MPRGGALPPTRVRGAPCPARREIQSFFWEGVEVGPRPIRCGANTPFPLPPWRSVGPPGPPTVGGHRPLDVRVDGRRQPCHLDCRSGPAWPASVWQTSRAGLTGSHPLWSFGRAGSTRGAGVLSRTAGPARLDPGRPPAVAAGASPGGEHIRRAKSGPASAAHSDLAPPSDPSGHLVQLSMLAATTRSWPTGVSLTCPSSFHGIGRGGG